MNNEIFFNYYETALKEGGRNLHLLRRNIYNMNITIYKPTMHKPLHAMSGLLPHHTKHTMLLLRVSALTWVNTVVKFLPFIEPNLCQACVVMVYYFRSTARKGIRGGFAKHMTHMGASGNFQVTATHPNLQQGSRASHHTMCSSHSFVDTANTYSDTKPDILTQLLRGYYSVHKHKTDWDQ